MTRKITTIAFGLLTVLISVTIVVLGSYDTVAAKCSQVDNENGSCLLLSSRPAQAPLIAYDLTSLVTALIVLVTIIGGASVTFFVKAVNHT